MMKRVFALGLITVFFVSLVAFTQEKVLHWNLGVNPTTIDPSYATSTASQQIDHALFLGLTDIDDKTLKVVPRLATSWKVSEDGTTWTFHLRREAMWSDGTPVTAHDITFAIERTLDLKLPSPLAQKLYVLKGAEKYHSGSGRARDVGVEAIDNHTVRFTLIAPNDCFPALLSEPVFYPQPRSIVEDYGTNWTQPEHIVTDGAYILGQWVNDRIILYKSATYYAADKVDIDEVYCHVIEDEQEALVMYKGGKIDVTAVGEDQLEEIKADPMLSRQLRIYPSAELASTCLPTLTYPVAQLTKPYIVRTYGLLGREKWENWDIQR